MIHLSTKWISQFLTSKESIMSKKESKKILARAAMLGLAAGLVSTGEATAVENTTKGMEIAQGGCANYRQGYTSYRTRRFTAESENGNENYNNNGKHNSKNGNHHSCNGKSSCSHGNNKNDSNNNGKHNNKNGNHHSCNGKNGNGPTKDNGKAPSSCGGSSGCGSFA